jgi:hypothetical protein
MNDEYVMKEVCSVFAGLDYQGLSKKKPELKVMNFRAGMAFNYYFGCYNVDHGRAIKQQIIDIGVAQLALFKSVKLDIAAISPSIKASTKITEPKNVDALLAQANAINTLGIESSYTKRYVRAIKELQDVKASIWDLPYCQSLTPNFDRARRDLCYIPLKNGIRMFWMNILVIIGLLFLAWVFLNAEIRIKKNMDGAKYQPSQLFWRFANYTPRVDDHIKFRCKGEREGTLG